MLLLALKNLNNPTEGVVELAKPAEHRTKAARRKATNEEMYRQEAKQHVRKGGKICQCGAKIMSKGADTCGGCDAESTKGE